MLSPRKESNSEFFLCPTLVKRQNAILTLVEMFSAICFCVDCVALNFLSVPDKILT